MKLEKKVLLTILSCPLNEKSALKTDELMIVNSMRMQIDEGAHCIKGHSRLFMER